jgi:hypothetical protein
VRALTYVAVARFQRRPHGLLHLLGLRPPRAQAHRGHLQDAVDGCQFDVLHGSAGWGRARASTETLQLDCDAIYTELRSSVRTNLTLILDRRFFERFVYVFVLSGVGMLAGVRNLSIGEAAEANGPPPHRFAILRRNRTSIRLARRRTAPDRSTPGGDPTRAIPITNYTPVTKQRRNFPEILIISSSHSTIPLSTFQFRTIDVIIDRSDTTPLDFRSTKMRARLRRGSGIERGEFPRPEVFINN